MAHKRKIRLLLVLVLLSPGAYLAYLQLRASDSLHQMRVRAQNATTLEVSGNIGRGGEVLRIEGSIAERENVHRVLDSIFDLRDRTTWLRPARDADALNTVQGVRVIALSNGVALATFDLLANVRVIAGTNFYWDRDGDKGFFEMVWKLTNGEHPTNRIGVLR
jgi:hypothetical protein